MMEIEESNPSIIYIIMIDDDEEHYKTLKTLAAYRNIRLLYSSNLNDGLNQIRANGNILGVILDGKGLLTPSSTSSFPTEAFVHEAIKKIEKLREETQRPLPFVVLTAWANFLSGSLEPVGHKVFDKQKVANDDSELERMFESLRQEIQITREARIAREYKEYLDLFDDVILPKWHMHKLLSALIASDRSVTGNFNQLRILSEKIAFKCLEELEKVGDSGAKKIIIECKSGGVLRFVPYYFAQKPVRNNGVVIADANPFLNDKLMIISWAIDSSKTILHPESHARLVDINVSNQTYLHLYQIVINCILIQLRTLHELVLSGAWIVK